MGVNVTLLMVLSALFISVLDSMPRTAYVKMIDIWLLFCLTIPLLEIMFHAILDKYRYELELEEEEQREAIAVTDTGYWTTSECEDGCPLWYYARK